MLIAEAGNRT